MLKYINERNDKMIIKPKGTYDILGIDAKLHTYLNHEIENFMINYDYELIRTPIFESSELFHRSVGEGTDIVTKETYDFKDGLGGSALVEYKANRYIITGWLYNDSYMISAKNDLLTADDVLQRGNVEYFNNCGQ